MEYTNLLTEYNDGILVVTINRPKALNALNKQTLSDLRQLFEKDALNLEGLRGVVLTGAGEKGFVAGADITEFSGLDAQGGLHMAQNGHDIFFSIERFHVPVVAAVVCSIMSKISSPTKSDFVPSLHLTKRVFDCKTGSPPTSSLST